MLRVSNLEKTFNLDDGGHVTAIRPGHGAITEAHACSVGTFEILTLMTELCLLRARAVRRRGHAHETVAAACRVVDEADVIDPGRTLDTRPADCRARDPAVAAECIQRRIAEVVEKY